MGRVAPEDVENGQLSIIACASLVVDLRHDGYAAHRRPRRIMSAMATEQRAVTCSYVLDQQLTIQSVGPGWDEFALENGAPESLSPTPIGQPLMMFVTDATTIHLYELMFNRVAREKRPITLPIRCDAPDVRRFLNLTIASGVAGRFQITTSQVRSERRSMVDLLSPDAARHEGVLTMCG
jgi:hypothetical protein